jgi:transcription initiation factor IIE alpha subunit
MSQVPFESHYEKYPSHRKFLLKNATSVDWVYCDEVHLHTKLVIADAIRIEESISKTELQEKTNVSKSHIQRILPILEKENVVTTDNRNRELTIKNTGITEGYIGRLDNIANEKDDFGEDKDTSSNVTRVEI